MDDHGHALIDIVNILLVDGPLDPVGPGLHDLDEGVVGAAVVGAAVLIRLDALDDAVDLAVDRGVLDVVLQLVDFLLLAGDVVLPLLLLQLLLLDLDGVVGLFAGLGLLLLLFELGDGGVHALQLDLQPLQVDLRLGQVILVLLHVVNEERRALLHLVAHLDVDLGHLALAVLLHGPGLLGLDDAGEPVQDAKAGTAARQNGHLGDIDDVPAFGAGAAAEALPGKVAASGQQGHHDEGCDCFHHTRFLLFLHSKLLLGGRGNDRLSLLSSIRRPYLSNETRAPPPASPHGRSRPDRAKVMPAVPTLYYTPF